MVRKVVIVGTGQGGIQAAISLRELDPDCRITVIGREQGLPYQRPPLSKTYLNTGEAERLMLRPQAFFEQKGIPLLTGTEVTRIDRSARQVVCADSRHDYDHLILATGARNLRPPIPGLERALDLRTLADAERLRGALQKPRRIAVIGGGFVGLEFAAAARALGHAVTVMEAGARVMARAISPAMSARFQTMHEELGTQLRLGVPVVAVTEAGVILDGGERVDADLVLLAAGARPNVELAEAAGLAVANGVVVDARLRTADPAIYALGDCCAFPDARSGTMLRLESVQAAVDHARFIARQIVEGGHGPYGDLPWFWSDQGDWKLQIAGFAGTSDLDVERDNTVFRFRNGVLTAVETVNSAKVHMLARRVLASDQPTLLAALQNVDFNLAALAMPAAA